MIGWLNLFSDWWTVCQEASHWLDPDKAGARKDVMYFVNPLILRSGDKSKDENPCCLMKALLRLTSIIFLLIFFGTTKYYFHPFFELRTENELLVQETLFQFAQFWVEANHISILIENPLKCILIIPSLILKTETNFMEALLISLLSWAQLEMWVGIKCIKTLLKSHQNL